MNYFIGMSVRCREFLSFSKLPKMEKALNRRQRGGFEQNGDMDIIDKLLFV